MIGAEGIIIGSPTYFANVSTEVKALIDRAGLVAIANNHLLRRKVGAAVVAVRRAGGTDVYSAINYFFGINHMIMPGSSYWNLAVGLDPGDVLKDKEGMINHEGPRTEYGMADGETLRVGNAAFMYPKPL